MRITSSIQFYCRQSKANKQGFSPLECSVTLCGSRKFINLPMKFKASEFNKRKPDPSIVECLDLWRNRINDYTIQMMREGMVITAETLRQVIADGGVRAYTVGRLFDDYLILLRKRVGINLKDTVYRKYEIVAEKALKFVRRDADCSALTPSLIRTIEADWRAVFDPSTLCGYLTRLKSFIKYGMDNGHITVNPFQGVKITKPKKEIKYLTEEQTIRLRNAVMPTDCLQRVLDLFLIQCGTGMAYADLMEFKKEDLKEEGGNYYISKKRVKTGSVFTALVIPWCLPIINHYNTLPHISNQKFNKYLKEVGAICGIPNLTTHYGRRSYATFLANRNLDIGTVAACLGDNPAVASQYYAKIFESTIVKKAASIL